MTNDEEIDGLRELAQVMLQMLRDLANGCGWDELDTTLDAVEDDAGHLKVVP